MTVKINYCDDKITNITFAKLFRPRICRDSKTFLYHFLKVILFNKGSITFMFETWFALMNLVIEQGNSGVLFLLQDVFGW
jgi:hypothetical protein